MLSHDIKKLALESRMSVIPGDAVKVFAITYCECSNTIWKCQNYPHQKKEIPYSLLIIATDSSKKQALNQHITTSAIPQLICGNLPYSAGVKLLFFLL